MTPVRPSFSIALLMAGILLVAAKLILGWVVTWLALVLLVLGICSLPGILGLVLGFWQAGRVPRLTELWTDRSAIASGLLREFVRPVVLWLTSIVAGGIVFAAAMQTAARWDNSEAGYVSLPGGRPPPSPFAAGQPTSSWLYIARDVHKNPNAPKIAFGARRVLMWRNQIEANQPGLTPLDDGDCRLRNLEPWPLVAFDNASTWNEIRQLHHDRPLIVVFVHGYANTPASAQQTAAVVARARPTFMHTASFISYEWRSAGSVARYEDDEQAVDGTAHSLRWFLGSLVAANPNAVLVVVAHSMGSRAVFKALTQRDTSLTSEGILSTGPGARRFMKCDGGLLGLGVQRWQNGSEPRTPLVNLAVLIAPDIEADSFVQAFSTEGSRLATAVGRFVIVGSDKDEVLKASAARHSGAIRLGQGPPSVRALAGLTFVDCTACAGSNFGHSYSEAALRKLAQALERAPSP